MVGGVPVLLAGGVAGLGKIGAATNTALLKLAIRYPWIAKLLGIGGTAVASELADGDELRALNDAVKRATDTAQSGGFDTRQVQHVYSNHAEAFGFTKNWNAQVGLEFEQTLLEHVSQFSDQAIEGTYRGTMQVIHYFDPSTNLNVMLDLNGNLVSGWQLGPEQVYYLLTNGNVQ
jgi:hypothetical protein